MTIYTNKHSAVTAMISRHLELNQDTISQISIDSGIGRQQIHRWLNGTATKIHNRSLHAVADALGYNVAKTPDGIEISHHSQEKESSNHMEHTTLEKNDTVAMQSDLIRYQKQEIDKLKKEQNEAKLINYYRNEEFDSFIYDVSEEICVKNFLNPLSVTLTKHTNAIGQDKIIKALGLPKNNEYIVNDKWFPMHEHPMDELIVQESQDRLKQIRTFCENFLKMVEFVYGLHFITVPIVYTYNDKTVHTVTALKVDYRNRPIRIFARTKISSIS